jgi:uncharacterized protein YegP (UPF0339 family)
MGAKMRNVRIYKGKAGNQKGSWYFQIRANNGEIQATSEGYTSKRDAKRGFFALVKTVVNGSLDEIIG